MRKGKDRKKVCVITLSICARTGVGFFVGVGRVLGSFLFKGLEIGILFGGMKGDGVGGGGGGGGGARAEGGSSVWGRGQGPHGLLFAAAF